MQFVLSLTRWTGPITDLQLRLQQRFAQRVARNPFPPAAVGLPRTSTGSREEDSCGKSTKQFRHTSN